MKKFFIALFFLVLLISILDYLWMCFTPVEKHIPHVWIIITFFAITTAIFYYSSLRTFKNNPQAFIRSSMIKTALRLLLCLAALLIYRAYDKSTLSAFAIGFILHYFIFSTFEVLFIRKELHKS